LQQRGVAGHILLSHPNLDWASSVGIARAQMERRGFDPGESQSRSIRSEA